MAHLALYRKYRPSTFTRLLGQEHIVQTLTNQIKFNQVGHAYLFCGTRGTGKTSTAKMFARAINCLSPLEDFSACGKCEVCKALSEGSQVDVVEIDAASNNSVAEMRDLIEKVQFAPVIAKYKVYIIDEVHMLSDSAFNALLKTLEEPPRHVVFILATTEAHKIPATILSRCMRFDFNLVPTNDILGVLEEAFNDCKKEYELEALKEIAISAEGCFRDALSLAEICLTYSEGKLTLEDVLMILGSANKEKVFALGESILNSNLKDVIKVTKELFSRGKNVGVLVKDMITYFNGVMICKNTENPISVLNLPKSQIEKMQSASNQADMDRLIRITENFIKCQQELRYASSPQIVFLTTALKCGTAKADYSLEGVHLRLKQVEKELEEIKKGGVLISSETPSPKGSENIKEDKPLKEIELTEVEEDFDVDMDIETEEIAVSSFEKEKKIWASVLKEVENLDFEIKFACGKGKPKYENGKITIYFDSPLPLKTLKENDNYKKLVEIAKKHGTAVLNFVYSKEDNNDNFMIDVKEIKDTFSGVVEIKD